MITYELPDGKGSFTFEVLADGSLQISGEYDDEVVTVPRNALPSLFEAISIGNVPTDRLYQLSYLSNAQKERKRQTAAALGPIWRKASEALRRGLEREHWAYHGAEESLRTMTFPVDFRK